MCDPLRESKGISRRLGGLPIEQAYPPETIQQRLPVTVQKNHCLACNMALSHTEMYPPGVTPRYMHQGCYENLAYNTDRNTCLWCGRYLPQQQVQLRISNPRELKYAFCDGNCWEYQLVLAGLVFGVPFNIMGSIQSQLMQPSNTCTNQTMLNLLNYMAQDPSRYLGNGNTSRPPMINGKPVKYLP